MTTLIRRAGVTSTTSAGPRLAIVKNVVNNPRAVTATGLVTAWGSGGTGVTSLVATGGPLADCPTFFRSTWTTAQTATTSAVQIRNGLDGVNLVSPSKVYVFKAYVRASYAAIMQPKFGWWNGNTYVSAQTGGSFTLNPNQWTQITIEGTSAATASRVQLNTDPSLTSPLPAAGATIDITGWIVYEKALSDVGGIVYADGSSVGWSWLGTPHASASQGYGAITE